MLPTTPPSRRRRSRTAGAAIALLAAAALAAAGTAPAQAAPAQPARTAKAAGHDVSANLFEWNWRSVAKACTTQLGPAGYPSVQVAPPQTP